MRSYLYWLLMLTLGRATVMNTVVVVAIALMRVGTRHDSEMTK